MKIKILNVDLSPVYGDPYYLSDTDLEELISCPVCDDSENQILLAQVEGSEAIGLAISRCGECCHTYLSRRPSSNWYQHYYAESWDSGRLALNTVGLVHSAKNILKKLPGIYRLVRSLKSFNKRDGPLDLAERLRSMLEGINGPDSRPLVTGSNVLEIGVGYGGALSAFSSLGFRAVGTEACRNRVAACRRDGHTVVETAIDDLRPAKPYGPFDMVYSSHVFEHLSDLNRMLENIKPLVREDSLIYIEVPNAVVAESLLHRSHVPVHCHMFSDRSLVTLMLKHGFGIVRIHSDMNLHVVCKKGVESSIPLPGIIDQQAMHRGIVSVNRTSKVLIVQYDGIHEEIYFVDGHLLCYEQPDPYGYPRIERADNNCLVNEFVVQGCADSDSYETLHFIHSDEFPPVWLKRQ